ncbi:site-specific DNA-methyltransferase [Brochothrix thermosphacta]|uniref:site-specific DNA-methyltransferase n=1 Tax=Brochothrix thermosphacta TaxID=2756 RepID=UPI0039AEAEFE
MSKELRPFNVESEDITTDNIEKLKELFPEILTENKVDFEKLRLILGDDVEESPERYNFTWNGKKQAMKLAQQPTTATLKPNKDKSKNWDNTQNIYIEGDNLEVLKLLQKSYANRIKMIYIDPPYNTGKDFVYKDNFHDSVKNYLEQTGQIDSEGNKLSVNTETSGRYHTDWLNMMYPRLKLARNLLTEDGVIFVSIGNSEVQNIERMLNEIFGENNKISTMVWQAGRKNDANFISDTHDYILIYAKNKTFLAGNKVMFREEKPGVDRIINKAEELYKKFGEKEGSVKLKEWFKNLSTDDEALASKHYNSVDDRGAYFKGDISWPGGGGPVYDVTHPITGKPVKIPSRGWLFQKDRLNEIIDDNRVSFGEDETAVPTMKRYLKEISTQVPASVFYKDNRGSMKRLRELMDGAFFEFPKDESVLQRLISFVPMDDNAIIMDFFSGSSSTANAVLNLNAETGKKLKFIMIQLPEILDDSSAAYKAGYRYISDIAEERIRRAGEKIVSEKPEQEGQLDIGFKVLELSNSNIKKWDFDDTNVESQIEMQLENIESNTNDFNLVYEIMLKQGLDLSLPIEESHVGEAKIYKIAYGALFIVLGSNIKSEVATKIVSIIKDQNLEDVSVVIKDTGFINDSEKLNAIEILNTGNVQYDDILSL